MHARFLLVAASKLAQDFFRLMPSRLLLREGEGAHLQAIFSYYKEKSSCAEKGLLTVFVS
jgi:hypothetical protein